MAIAIVSSCRSRTTETIILSNSTCKKVGEKTSGQRESTASNEQKRNNNGVEQNKIRAYGEQQLVRVIPVIKKHQSKRTQDNVRSISKGGNENRMQQIRTRPPQEEETSNDDRKKRTKNRTSNQNNHNNNIKTTKHRRHGVGHFLKK